MPQDRDPVRFDLASSRRIADVVKRVERAPTSMVGDVAREVQPQKETIIARLTGNTGNGWTWDEVIRNDDGSGSDQGNGGTAGNTTWVTSQDLRHGTAANPSTLAKEYLGRQATPTVNSIVLLRRCMTQFPSIAPDPRPVWQLGWLIVDFPLVAWIKLTSPQAAYSAGPPPAGGGAYYNAALVTGAPVTIDPTTDLVAPIDPCEAVGTAGSILAMNWAEANLGDPPTHWVQCPAFVPAWYVGTSNEEPARPVYRFYVPRPGPVDAVVIDALGSSGTGGARYKIAVMLGSVIGLDTATNFHGTDNGTSYPNTFNAYWTNVFEGGSATSGTNLLDVGSFVRGSFVGMASDGNPVFYGSSAPTGTTFRVLLTAYSGSSSPGWTYSPTTLGGLPLTPTGTYASPEYRPFGATINTAAAIKGTGYLDQNGAFILWMADEIPSLETCSTIP